MHNEGLLLQCNCDLCSLIGKVTTQLLGELHRVVVHNMPRKLGVSFCSSRGDTMLECLDNESHETCWQEGFFTEKLNVKIW